MWRHAVKGNSESEFQIGLAFMPLDIAKRYWKSRKLPLIKSPKQTEELKSLLKQIIFNHRLNSCPM
jgi:hypothetical protein